MVLPLRYKVNTRRFAVEFSFGLKIWNSFVPLTFLQLQWGANTWICNTRKPLISALLVLIVQFISQSLSLSAYTLALLGQSYFLNAGFFTCNMGMVILALDTLRVGVRLINNFKRWINVLSACSFFRHGVKGFAHIISFNPYINAWKLVVLLSPFHRWGYF